MFKDAFDSVTDFVKTRLTNPFLGTLLVVWLIRNFEFVYALFNFADGVTLTQKEDYIRRYFAKYGTCDHFLENVGYAMCLMLLGFGFLLMTRAATNFYSIALNYLNKHTDKGSVVSRLEFEGLEKQAKIIKTERDQLRTEAGLHDSSLNDLKDNIRDLMNERAQLTVEVQERDKEIKEITSNKNAALSENEKLTEELNILKGSTENSGNKIIEKHGNTNIIDDKEALEILENNMENDIVFALSQKGMDEEQSVKQFLRTSDLPSWLIDRSNLDVIYTNISNLKKDKVYRQFSKRQKEFLNGLFLKEYFLKFLYYCNFIEDEDNAKIFIEISTVDLFYSTGLMEYLQDHVEDDEIEAEQIVITERGIAIQSFLTEGVVY